MRPCVCQPRLELRSSVILSEESSCFSCAWQTEMRILSHRRIWANTNQLQLDCRTRSPFRLRSEGNPNFHAAHPRLRIEFFTITFEEGGCFSVGSGGGLVAGFRQPPGNSIAGLIQF